MADFHIKQHNTARPITAMLKDENGPVDLTGADVLFVMQAEGTSAEPKVSAAATPDPDQTNNKGRATYSWEAADVDTSGVFLAEWVATLGDGSVITFPNEGHLVVEIAPALGTGAFVAAVGTQAEKDLEAVRRALVPETSAGVQEYEINGVGSGRRLRNYSKEDLLRLEESLAQRVNAEKRRAAHAQGAPYFKTIYPR